MKEQTKKEMQQKMAECQMSAPDVSWAEIEQAVGVRTAGARKRHAMITPTLRKRIAAVAAVVIILTAGGIGLWMLPYQEQSEPVSDVTTVPHAYPKMVAALPAEKNDAQVESIRKPEDSIQAKEHVEEDNSAQTAEQTVEQTPQARPHFPTTTARPQTVGHSTPHHTVTSGRLAAKVYIGNAMNGYISSTTFTPMLMSASPFGAYDDEMGDESASTLYGDFPKIQTNVRHHQPLRFGLSLRYAINNRWSIESGLSYSRHKSDITNLSGNREMAIDQRLSYVGIPLSASYRVWSGKRLGVYASAGGMAEKMVKGSCTVQAVTDGKSEQVFEESVSIRPLQFSVNCAAGVEFCVSKTVSLYAEPELSCHFDNHSSVPTIYQDEPLNLNINIGLRLTFPRIGQ